MPELPDISAYITALEPRIIGQPLQITSTSTNQDFEAERLRLQSAMLSLVERR